MANSSGRQPVTLSGPAGSSPAPATISNMKDISVSGNRVKIPFDYYVKRLEDVILMVSKEFWWERMPPADKRMFDKKNIEGNLHFTHEWCRFAVPVIEASLIISSKRKLNGK